MMPVPPVTPPPPPPPPPLPLLRVRFASAGLVAAVVEVQRLSADNGHTFHSSPCALFAAAAAAAAAPPALPILDD